VAAIHAAQKKKGCVMIPSFALGRTQEILALLALLMREGKLKKQPIYIGGLGRVFTEIYDIEAHRTHRQHTNLQLNEALQLIVLEKGAGGKHEVERRKNFRHHRRHDEREHGGARSGGADDRRREAEHFLRGLRGPGFAGGTFEAAKPGETFVFSPSAGRVTKNCDMQDFDLTAHANREDLLEFVGQVSPRAILLGHGDDARGVV
jgi:Cft2 family RNA processing exonuclease